MIEPVLRDDAFLADVRVERGPGPRLWWLGQSGFLVQWQGRHLLIDPYLSESLSKKYAHTDKPHVRMTARVVAPERLDFIDVATSSHNHTDHLDAGTLVPLLGANPGMRLILPEANREFAAGRLAIDRTIPIGIAEGSSAEVAGFRLTGVPSAHEHLAPEFLGYVIECGPRVIYHPGDTVLYPGMEERLMAWRIDLALLPINGAKPERRVAGNLDGREAAELAHRIGAALAVPMHYEMFEFNTAAPDEFMARCAELGQPYRVLRCGERLDLCSPG